MDIAMLVPVGEPDEPAVPKQRKPIEVVVTYI
jgi:nitroreductase